MTMILTDNFDVWSCKFTPIHNFIKNGFEIDTVTDIMKSTNFNDTEISSIKSHYSYLNHISNSQYYTDNSDQYFDDHWKRFAQAIFLIEKNIWIILTQNSHDIPVKHLYFSQSLIMNLKDFVKQFNRMFNHGCNLNVQFKYVDSVIVIDEKPISKSYENFRSSSPFDILMQEIEDSSNSDNNEIFQVEHKSIIMITCDIVTNLKIMQEIIDLRIKNLKIKTDIDKYLHGRSELTHMIEIIITLMINRMGMIYNAITLTLTLKPAIDIELIEDKLNNIDKSENAKLDLYFIVLETNRFVVSYNKYIHLNYDSNLKFLLTRIKQIMYFLKFLAKEYDDLNLNYLIDCCYGSIKESEICM